jgi:soluble lytic murein transglycosylase
MPRVPDLGPVQADTRPLTGFHADASADNPSLAAIPGQQTQQLGNALLDDGNSALRIATDMQERINQTQVDDALNKMRQTTLDLTYNPDTGYQAVKGRDALQREGGVSLADEYGQKLQETTDKLMEDLGNDAQRRQFSLRANDVATSFQGNIEAHTLQEFKNYSLSVQDGAIKLGQDDAKRNWTDPVKIDTSVKSVQAAVVKAGQLQGKSANQILAEMKTATSMVHLGVIDAALQNNNPTYAHQYLQKYTDQMTADDILRVNGAINQDLDGRIAQQAVAQSVQTMAPKFQPSNLDRMMGITAQTESGNKDFKPDGTPVTSSAGAMFTMQVMPATAKNPGFGITPAKDDSPAEYNRVGQQYLTALVQKYGNPAMAWAAYNAGPGALDDAMQKANAAGAPQNWLTYMPKETQGYVKTNMDKLGAGMGGGPVPTELEFVNDAVARLGNNPRPQQVKLAREAAEHQYSIITKSYKEQGDQALSKAQQALIANGGDFNALPYDLKTALSQYGAGKLDDVMKFAKRISKGDDETNPELYMKLATYPEEAAKLSDAQFMQLRTQLSEADFKHFSKERADTLNGTATDNSEAINSKALNTALTNRLTSLGIDAAPKPSDLAGRQRVGTVQKFVRDDIFAQQQQLGRKMTPAEIEQHVDGMFAKNVNFRNTIMGVETGGVTQQSLLGMTVKDIPSASLDALRQQFNKAGTRNPTDDQLLRAYWTLKKNNG